MGIQFQCESESFAAAFAKAKVLLAKQEKQLCGYEEETSNAVYGQMEAVYKALSEVIYKALSECKSEKQSNQINQTNQADQTNQTNQTDQSNQTNQGNQTDQTNQICQGAYSMAAERERLFGGQENILLTASVESAGTMDFAVYYCALLLESGLHPVMIFGEDQVAVGVWMYEDYNVGEARISAPEFAEEAYDAGGMLLPVDCACFMKNALFSEAVATGCQVTADFVFAVDIALENESFSEPAVILADPEGNQKPLPDFSDDGTCSYFEELLFLYDQVAGKDPAAVSILDDAVRHQQWAAAFFGEMDLPKLEMGLLETDLTEAIEQMPLLMVKMEKKLQEALAAEVVLQDLEQGKKILILTSKERLDKIEDFLSGEGISASMLVPDKISSSSEVYILLKNRCQEKEKTGDKRVEVKKRRYGEIVEKLENYTKILEEQTGCGKTLGELLDGWDAVKECEINLIISPDRKWNADTLELVEKYANAQEKCYQRDKDGDVYLDFSRLTLSRKDHLVQLLHACEKPAGALYTEVEKFGQKIGRMRGQNETARSYLQAITGCAELLEGCLSLLKLQKMPEYIPEPQESDKEERKFYDDYLKRRHNLNILSQYMDISELQLIGEEDRELLFAACREVQNERSNYSLIKSRAYKVALKKIREILEQLLKSGVEPGRLDSKNWNSICEGILEYSTYISREEESDGAESRREQVFQKMTDLLGNHVHSNAYLFTYQKMLIQNLFNLEESGMISPSLGKKLAECILSASKQTEPGQERKKLYEDARKLIEDSDSYSEALKEVFRFLKIDYHTFLKSYENESMMSFVMTWEQLLVEEKVYDEFHKLKTILLRSQMGSVLEQFDEKNLTPERMVRAFKKAWYHHNLVFYMEEKGFDLQDYTMNLASLDKIKEQLRKNDGIQLENRLLRDVWKACEIFQDEMDELKMKDKAPENGLIERNQMGTLQTEDLQSEIHYLEKAPHLLVQAFPVMLMTPEKSWILQQASEVFFDRILLCGAEEIPFYKVLYPVTRGRSLLIIAGRSQQKKLSNMETGESDLEMDSVSERAQKMKFPEMQGDL